MALSIQNNQYKNNYMKINQNRQHDTPAYIFPVFNRNIQGADADHDDGQTHGFAVLHDQREKSHRDHGGSKSECALDAGA